MTITLPGPGTNVNVHLTRDDVASITVVAPPDYTPEADFGTVSILMEGFCAFQLDEPQSVKVDHGFFLLSAPMLARLQNALGAISREFAALRTLLANNGIS